MTEVIDHLNNVAGSSYRSTTETTRKAILARRGEGYDLDDFKLVIDDRWEQWRGGKMEEFMRPDTLFKPSKFEGYLSEAKKHQKAKEQQGQQEQIVSDADKPKKKRRNVAAWEIVEYPPESGQYRPWWDVPEEDRAEYEPKLPER